jgi:RNA polymerase sigma factor (sigma-70 family)
VDRTDAELPALIRGGDRQAEATFAARHSDWARVYARRLGAGDEALDVAQNVLLDLISRPPIVLKNKSARPYMADAIWHEVARGARGRIPAALVTGESSLLEIAASGTSPSAAAARREFVVMAWQAISELRTAQRTVVLLRYVQGMTFGEISSITGRPEDTERRSHGRALVQLRRKIFRSFLSRSGC